MVDLGCPLRIVKFPIRAFDKESNESNGYAEVLTS